jgi:hypothetical protein
MEKLPFKILVIKEINRTTARIVYDDKTYGGTDRIIVNRPRLYPDATSERFLLRGSQQEKNHRVFPVWFSFLPETENESIKEYLKNKI